MLRLSGPDNIPSGGVLADPAYSAEMGPKRPWMLWVLVVVCGVQAVLNLLAGVEILNEVSSAIEHNRDVAGLVHALGVVSILGGVALAGGAMMMALGYGWARIPIAVVEVLTVLSGLYGLLFAVAREDSVVPTLLGSFGVPIAVLFLLTARKLSDWHTQLAALRRSQPDAMPH